VVQGTLDMVLEALLKGDKVEFRNFGVFEVI
jgi:nucleoid DNA-binding protein